MIVNVEHMEATERNVVTSGEGGRVAMSFTVTAIVEVTGVESMGDAVKRVEWRLTHGVPLSPPDPPIDNHAHNHIWVTLQDNVTQSCRCGQRREVQP
jgi:hypothetical protein